MDKDSVHFSNNSNEWETPIALYSELDKEFSFTLDPCAIPENAKCIKYYTKKDNGLSKDWSGERVFMNPPYGKEIKYWVEKAYKESLNGAIVVCLIPARTDTSYWHNFIFPHAYDIRFLRGRIKFKHSGDGFKAYYCEQLSLLDEEESSIVEAVEENPAPFPSAIVIFKQNDF